MRAPCLADPEYYEMIARPMDLGTVKAALEQKQYATLGSFVGDVKVTFTNCCEFNDPTSLICTVARQLSACFEGLLEAWVMSPTKPPVKKMTARNADALAKPANSKRKKPKVSAEAKAAAKAAKAAERAAAKAGTTGGAAASANSDGPQKPIPGECRAAAKRRLHQLYFDAGRLGEPETESDEEVEDDEDEDEELEVVEDLELLESTDTVAESQREVALPTHETYSGLPDEVAATALSVWDFTSAMRRRVLSRPLLHVADRNKTYLSCSWEDFKYALLNPQEPATAAVIMYYLRSLIELTFIDTRENMPEQVNAMTFADILRRVFEGAALQQMLKPTSESNPVFVPDWSGIANMLSTVEYEDLTVHQLVELLDALSQLAMDTPTVRAYLEEVAEREEEWEMDEKREAALMLRTAMKEARSAKRAKKQESREPVATKARMHRDMVAAFSAIEQCKDSNRRQRCELFMHLPTKSDLPDYYALITRPISLYSVKERLRMGNVYTSWALFREDIELVFANARQYNHPTSEIYQDAMVLLNAFNSACPRSEADPPVHVLPDVRVRVLPRDITEPAIDQSGRVPYDGMREELIDQEGYVMEVANGLAQVKFQEADPVMPAHPAELTRDSEGRIVAFPVACLAVMVETVEPPPLETKTQAEKRVKLEASVKFSEMRDEHGSLRRECLGLDRHFRPYYIFGDDYSRIFCGTEAQNAWQESSAREFYSNAASAESAAPVCVHTVEELDALRASLLTRGQRESKLCASLDKVYRRCVAAMQDKISQDQRYAAGYNLTKRAIDRWAEPAMYLDHVQTRASQQLEQQGSSREKLYNRRLAEWKKSQTNQSGSVDKSKTADRPGLGSAAANVAANGADANMKTDGGDVIPDSNATALVEDTKEGASDENDASPGRLVRLKQEMLAMEEVIHPQARLQLVSENDRRVWIYKVLAADRAGLLCDLILEIANAVHDSWLEPWWKPWKVIKHDTQMTLEEQQAAIASGMLEDPEKAIEDQSERKRQEEDERKRKKESDQPNPWTDQEDADLKDLVCKQGIGMWVQKAAIHSAKGYARTANGLRHRFAQVISAGMTAEEIDTLRPEKTVKEEIPGYCAACHGAHKRHTCGKQKGGHLSKEAQEAEEDLAVLERARENLTVSTSVEATPQADSTLAEEPRADARTDTEPTDAAVEALSASELAEVRQAEAKKKAEEEVAVAAAAQAKKLEEAAKAKAAAAAAKAKAEAAIAEAEAEARAKAEAKAKVGAEAEVEEAATAATQQEEIRARRSSTRGRREPDRFEAGAAPAVVGGGEGSVVRKTEVERAAERVLEEIRYAPIPESEMVSTSIAMSHFWELDLALKYQYRGTRSLRAEEELTRLREHMVKMWEAVVAVEDDTVETESDEEDTSTPLPDPVQPVEEGSRVEVVEAFGGAWVGQQGLVVSKDHGYVRVVFDGDNRGILNLRLMHLRVVPEEKAPEVIVRDTRTPQLVDYYREVRLDHKLVRWYTTNPHGYQDPKPVEDLRKRSEIFMVLPARNDLPYYYRVIKRPIDLTMIREKIDNDKYSDMWRFKEDMELMFDNARQFNSEDSLVYEDACVLNDVFNELLEDAGLGDVKDSNLNLRVGMEVEVKWREVDEWHACTIKSVEEKTVDIHYSKTAQHEEFDETLLIEEISIDCVRPQSRASRITKPKVGPPIAEAKTAAKAAGKELDIPAMTVTGLPKPSRPEISSLPHEQMLKVWEAVRFVGDARGRDRGANFTRLPPRRETDYYAAIANPLHLMKIRGKIEKQRYDDIDGFEIDMATLFENARQYYEKGSRNYVDAEILQEVFWSALQIIETGNEYSIPRDWVYSAYPFYVEEHPSPVKTIQHTVVGNARARAERDKKARQRSLYVWLEIKVSPLIQPGSICKVHDEDTRVHFVRVPPREEMEKELTAQGETDAEESSADSDEDEDEDDGEAVNEDDKEIKDEDEDEDEDEDTGMDEDRQEEAQEAGEAYTAGGRSAEPTDSAHDDAAAIEKPADSPDAADVTSEKSTDDADPARPNRSSDKGTEKHTVADNDEELHTMDLEDSTDETKDPTTKGDKKLSPEDAETQRLEDETSTGIMYVFKRRVPKVYNDDIFRQMDKEELEHWLTHRNVSCTLQRLRMSGICCARVR
eukprot:COSAG02_NODE_1076_length_14725_cov_10.610215_3_plen_2136_part_00